jgi:hypothetical protein
MSDKTAPQSTADLRDARLAKALQHAPDANAAPTPALRDTIQTIAASAISARAAGPLPGKVSWWRRLWASTGSARRPWGGALATVVLGSIITAMWYGQKVPDEQVRYRSAAPEAAPASVAAPAPMQERVPTLAPLAKSVDKQTPPTEKAATEQLRVQAPTRAQTNELATAPEEKRAAPAAPPAMADKAQDQVATEAAPARREADAPSAPAVAGALSASGYAAAKAPSALLKSKAASAFDWHSATVQHQGRTTQLSTADASRLAAYVMAVVNTATPLALTASPTTLTTPPILRITFADAGGAQAAFTLWDGALQWQRPGQADIAGVPQADALAQLLAQVNALQK